MNKRVYILSTKSLQLLGIESSIYQSSSLLNAVENGDFERKFEGKILTVREEEEKKRECSLR